MVANPQYAIIKAMIKECKYCGVNFEITDEDLKFYESVSPIFDGKKCLIPPPTHCPDCRQQRRLACLNERYLYKGQCDLCHKFTLTQFPPHLHQPIYCRECWHSDKWDPCDNGLDFDFERPFFEQLSQLRAKTPLPALSIDGTNVNSEYMHYAGSSKNSYFIFHADFCESCYYGYGFKKNTSCLDGFYNLHCELCYDCVDVYKCYALKACQDCMNCSSSAFLRDCIGCKSCFLCVGMRNKEYCFENKQLSKEEYSGKMKEIDLGSYNEYQKWRGKLKELESVHFFKEFHGHNTENSFGDYLINCKNAFACFDCEDTEDAKFCYQLVLGAKNVFDIYQYGTNIQKSYECVICGGNAYGLLFTNEGTINCQDLLYCWYMEVSKNCFGCVGMHHKQYCILNKQYTKEQYEKMVPRIIEHMRKTPSFGGSSNEFGEFFPAEFSLFGYNKTTAQLYYPMSREQVLSAGLKWDDYEPPVPDVKKVIKSGEIPDNIKEVGDEILDYALECEITGKLFKITPQELKFYRQVGVPLPRRCPDQRHFDRFAKRNPRKFWKRNCEKCKKEVLTTYSPERLTIAGKPEMVCCEKCYEKVMY